jgi:class 3 adenylate cyclase
MKLRTKLLLGVGILLFAMVVILYIVPTFFIRKDVYKAAEDIHQLLIEDQQQLMRTQNVWLHNVLLYTKHNTNALLFMLYEESDADAFDFVKEGEEDNIWIELARFAGFDPMIGFIQVHSPEQNKTAVLTSNEKQLHLAEKTKEQKDGMTQISLLKENGKRENFHAIPLPKEMQVQTQQIFYVLFDKAYSDSKLNQIRDALEDLAAKLPEKKYFNRNQFFFGNGNVDTPFYLWGINVEMIHLLAPIYAEGEKESWIPFGLARLDEKEKGYGIQASDVFSTEPLFNDENYYQAHIPGSGHVPIAEGSLLVTETKSEKAYIANTLLFNQAYITIGAPLNFLAQQLALSSNKTILLNVRGNFLIGFDGQGEKIPRSNLEKILSSGIVGQVSGTLNIDNKPFFFSGLTTLEEGQVVFYEFHPLGGESSIVSMVLSLEEKLSQRISLQLSLISLSTMILVLLFIGRIGFTVIYPVTRLAAATQDVMAGRFGQVALPDVGKRKDEVAILTRSFSEMVKGLQEREKIRGVLDKVVSKDVAEEILRTQIHLGGEDRIVTMLFGDIRNFTQITATFSPQKTIQMLNECMTKVSRVIEGEGGVIDKYVGDEVMAIFGAPTSHSDHALRAVSSAMLIMETLKKWNEERLALGKMPVQMGMGIHTGLVVAGNMGAEDRLNYTVLGSNVNLAARLCEVAKPNQLIISAAVLAEPNIEQSFYSIPLTPIHLKGFADVVQIYEVTGFKWD